jgi:hypothetical protein
VLFRSVQKVRGKATTNEEFENIQEGFSEQHLEKLRQEYGKITGMDPSSPLYKKFINYLDNLSLEQLKQLAGANIKFISGLAKNRVARKSMKEDVENLDEKAVSQAQQKFMGMVHATQKGDMEAPSPEVAKAAGSMTKKAAKDFASTKLAGLPKHVDEELDESVRVDHGRYERSHKKTASGNGYWMFTNKANGPVTNYDDETKVHRYNGKFGEAKKSAIEWAKKHGHHTAYVMEEVELDENATDDFHNKWWRKRDKERSAAQINTPNRSKEESDARTEKLKREQEKLQQRYGGVQKEETYYVIHKKSRTPGEVSSRAGENIAGVTIKDKYHDRKEASAHAKHIDKQSLFRNVHGSKLGHGVGKWVNGELQEEVDEVDEGNKYNKLLKNMHARKVGATRMRDHGSPELNRIAALKKGRELMKNSYEPEGEELDEDPCWKNYQMVGMKTKNGKKVPNCVPVKNEELSRDASIVKEVYNKAKAEASAKDARRGGPQSSKKKENFDSEPEMDILPIASERSGKKKL